MSTDKSLLEAENQPSYLGAVSGSALPVIRVNHGDVWGHKNGGNWNTFYCPNCKRQLEAKGDCTHCIQWVYWGL